jgi:hypothetical protein
MRFRSLILKLSIATKHTVIRQISNTLLLHYKAATIPARTMPKPARPLFRLSAPPVDTSTAADEVAEPVALCALVDEAELEEPETTVVASEAMEEVPEVASLEAEEVTDDESVVAAAAEEELSLAAEVELAAPEAHVAAVGRLLTP